MADSDLIDGTLIAETAAAYHIKVDKTAHWIPKSLVDRMSRRYNTLTETTGPVKFTLPAWKATKLGW